MKIIISPSKRLDFKKNNQSLDSTFPVFIEDAQVLIDVLKKYSPGRISKLMSINPNLAMDNFERFQNWTLPFTQDNSLAAIYAFKGDVYNGLKAESLTEQDLLFAQKNLRILSGLYGILKPSDLIQPYRLEMGTKLKVKRKKNLYEFWGSKIAQNLHDEMENDKNHILINLASSEYFKVLKNNALSATIITPQFLDYKNGTYKFLSVFGKKARGLLTRFIIERRMINPEEIKLFDWEGYYYNDNLSNGNNWIFTRG